MDKTIRRNEVCVIGQPRCDFVFSSTRSCFIAYGFEESPLEMSIIQSILEERGIQAIEAAGHRAPAQNAFCAKICSKIIAAQFCIVLLNNDKPDKIEVPNANVNMEYGLMLGFNKFIIPFQRNAQNLPFNVAGLDTIKYTNKNFKELATKAIDQAINDSQQNSPTPLSLDQVLETFLMSKKALVTPLSTGGDQSLYELGKPLGFNLLNNFSGMAYMFLGNFIHLRPEIALRRVKLLMEIINERLESIEERVKFGVINEADVHKFLKLIDSFQIWIILTSDEDKAELIASLGPTNYTFEIFSLNDVDSEMEAINIPVGLSN